VILKLLHQVLIIDRTFIGTKGESMSCVSLWFFFN